MYSNSFQFSLENFQPFFLYIKKCRMFEDELICLNPSYQVKKDGDKFVATKDTSYVDLTSAYGIDIIAICGRNGLGKTTLLRIMQAKNFAGDRDYELFWKDAAGNILGTARTTVVVEGSEITLDKDMFFIDTITGLCGNSSAGTDGLESNSLHRGFVQVYAQNPTIYDDSDKPLFDGFTIGYSPDFFNEAHELGDFYARKLNDDSALIEVSSILKEHPCLHVLADIAQDSTFIERFGATALQAGKSFRQIVEALMDDESNALDEEILKVVYSNGSVPSVMERLNDEDAEREYRFDEYIATRQEISRLSDKVDEWIEKKLKGFKVHLWKGRLNELLWDKPFKTQADGSRTGLSDLSQGEFQRVKMRYIVAPYLFQDQIGWFYFDDADARLHPEWSRRYVSDLATAFAETAKRVYKIKGKPKGWNRKLTCILVTHSPFILSDLMPQNILLLKPDGLITKVARGDRPTFAGNIGQMFHTEFFMENTIGEFARRNIQQAIKALDGTPTSDDREQIRKLFSNVGDDVLRNLLLEKLDHGKNRSQQ